MERPSRDDKIKNLTKIGLDKRTLPFHRFADAKARS